MLNYAARIFNGDGAASMSEALTFSGETPRY
jgi:hypothetical protein